MFYCSRFVARVLFHFQFFRSGGNPNLVLFSHGEGSLANFGDSDR